MISLAKRPGGLLRVAALAVALVPGIVVPAGAQQSQKARTLGKRMLCMCGCNQILTECNHIGCQVSAQMLKELDAREARHEPDDLTIQSFVQEYGEQVLVVPEAKGFNLLAWIMPIVALAAGTFAVHWVSARWRHRAREAPAVHAEPELLARARREADRESEL
jgi:cytochrome c-type biogenesis protein CcmH/NrfF